jgi:hypothetical protein
MVQMNQKAFAILVGAVMVLSAFAGFVLRGSNQNEIVVAGTDANSLQTFGVQGRLVDWSLDNLDDVLKMSPESTNMAYWINLTVSQNLTDATRAALPQSFGLSYGSQLYPNEIERLAAIYFNNTWIEFHWIKPFPVGYNGLVIPYMDYMMIPAGTDYVTVMGRPTIFGTQDAVRQSIDVITGGLATDSFTLPIEEKADLQVAILGKGIKSLPIANGYKEFYLGVSASKNGNNDGFNLTAKYLQPDASTSQKAKEISVKNNLTYSASPNNAEVTGRVKTENLQGVLMAFLGP